MKKAILLCFYLLILSIAFAYSSYTETPLFTLDTVAPTLNLIAPNGGEDWCLGVNNSILWNASDTNLSTGPVSLWYNLTGDQNYILLDTNIPNSGIYSWLVPAQANSLSTVRIEVRDAYGNTTVKTSEQYFNVIYAPPVKPTHITIDLTGNNTVLNWLPVTEAIGGTPITPDGYIILYNDTIYDDDMSYYFLARVNGTTYTHLDAVEIWDLLFYRIIAYKNYSRENLDYLKSLSPGTGKKRIPWVDVLKMMHQRETK